MPAKPYPTARAKPRHSTRTFHQDLVLNRWMLGFFHGDSLQRLRDRLEEDRHEGLHEDGQTLFFHELTANLFNIDRIDTRELRRFDLNIVEHWRAITTQRNKVEGHVLHMKYFQYLSLLFTEIYLDWYFNRREELLAGLNTALMEFHREEGDALFQPYQEEELNKIAFWNATGSGKTLLMHVNIRQYLHYHGQSRRGGRVDKILILTPNEGLSKQHLAEADLSGFSMVQLFEKDKTGTLSGMIEIIDINKLADSMGTKTVAVEAFEGNNLVLVDEGHRGAGKEAEAWMNRRAALISRGFAFEYSATFGQAVGKGDTVRDLEEKLRKDKAKMLHNTSRLGDISKEDMEAIVLDPDERRKARSMAMREVYAKCTLFDYSYKFFYEDGYGKEFVILNLKEVLEAERQSLYFTACLLSFYQQLWLFETHREPLKEFNIEKPLWVFVGNKVNDDDSDVLTVLLFLAEFVNDRPAMLARLKDLLTDSARILGPGDRNIFQGRFTPLMGRDAEDVYTDILRRLFNAESPQRLKLLNLKNSKGELALRIGEAEPFGLINIGDDAKFFKDLEKEKRLDCEEDAFGGSLFHAINRKDSRVNLLIGSRKFSEGWSSWRVSTMGLLNMGTGEGSQIIQLFGRGVRLKGRNFSLKRTSPSERPKGLHLEKLETLNIFGVRANYMAKFKEYLKEEGVTPTDEILQLDFETRSNLPKSPLKTLGLKDGYKDNQRLGFKRTHFPSLYDVPEAFIDSKTGSPKIKMPHVVIDLYPRVEALDSLSRTPSTAEARKKAKLNPLVFPHLNWDRVYLAVQDFKLRKSWSNLRVDRDRLRQFCLGPADWYTLYAPSSELDIRRYADVRKQEDLLIQLLVDYTERYYQSLKNAYEGQFYEVVPLSAEDGSVLKVYQFDIENSEEGLAYEERLQALQKLVRDGDIGGASAWNANQLVAVCFDRHLYYPLFHVGKDAGLPLKMRPVVFEGESELRFIRDLEAFVKTKQGQAAVGTRSLYLMRNADTKSKGIGFATAGNFYPDFLLWLVDDSTGKQSLYFLDPKGIRSLDLSHPKFQLYREIKKIEKELNDPNLTLEAYILSISSFETLLNIKGHTTKQDLEAKHVLFMDESPPLSYLNTLVRDQECDPEKNK